MRAGNSAFTARMAAFDAAHGEGYARQQIIKANAAAVRMRATHKPITREMLALIERRFESIKNPDQVDTAEKPADELTIRAISLVDGMAKEGHLARELAIAADTYRELFFKWEGQSKGVSSYGDYVQASPPSQRMMTSPEQMAARERLHAATIAAFGVKREDERWAIDEQLMQLVIPSILSDKKSITQGHIGKERTRYSDKTILRGAGGAIVIEVLNRLSLHFRHRER